VVLGLVPVAPAMGADYDLVINNGMITAKDSKVL
jgi:hypothetical protein